MEVIRGQNTSEQTIQFIRSLAEKLGNIPVAVENEVSGFALNRLQYPLFREAMHFLEQGVISMEDADKALKHGSGFRRPWPGAPETADLGGLDVFRRCRERHWRTGPPSVRIAGSRPPAGRGWLSPAAPR